jgi:hypothetical protein
MRCGTRGLVGRFSLTAEVQEISAHIRAHRFTPAAVPSRSLEYRPRAGTRARAKRSAREVRKTFPNYGGLTKRFAEPANHDVRFFTHRRKCLWRHTAAVVLTTSAAPLALAT